MTLPTMKIYTGGDRGYSERACRALTEIGAKGSHSVNFVPNYLCLGSMNPSVTFNSSDPKHIKNAYRLASNGNLVPAEADDEGWIEWGGGECPVEGNTIVDISFANGAVRHRCLVGRMGHPFDWRGDAVNKIDFYRLPYRVFPTSQRKLEPQRGWTPCERRGLSEGQWVWTRHLGMAGRWVRLDCDDDSNVPYFREGKATPAFPLELECVDWQAGIHNEKPDTEDSMSETPEWDGEGLPPMGLVCEAKRCNGEWEEVEVLKHGDGINSGTHEAACMCRKNGQLVWAKEFRRKPRTVRIEGDVGEWVVGALRRLSQCRAIDITGARDVADEILSTVQDQ